MDGADALDSIARMLTSLPDESVEGLLVAFNALVAVSDEAVRPTAARMLRDHAADCADPRRSERLLRAAGAVAAGQPCTLTADGLSAQQAAAALTVTDAEWERRIAVLPLPPSSRRLRRQ